MNRTLRIFVFILIGIALLLLFYAGVALIAFRSGQDERVRLAEQQLEGEVQQQIALAQRDVATGNTILAARRVDWLRANTRNDSQVATLEAALATLTPSQPVASLPRATASPDGLSTGNTPTPLPNVTPSATAADAEPRLRQANALLGQENWEEAIERLVALQLDYPSFERERTDQMLFDAYVGAGFEYTSGNRVSLGISYFEQARELGPLPDAASAQLYFAERYLTALSFYGVNWQITVDNLQEICTLAPNFQSACQKLYDAYIDWGDQLVELGEYCPAVEPYQSAVPLDLTDIASNRLADARAGCSRATVPLPPTNTPEPTWTPTADAETEAEPTATPDDSN